MFFVFGVFGGDFFCVFSVLEPFWGVFFVLERLGWENSCFWWLGFWGVDFKNSFYRRSLVFKAFLGELFRFLFF